MIYFPLKKLQHCFHIASSLRSASLCSLPIFEHEIESCPMNLCSKFQISSCDSFFNRKYIILVHCELATLCLASLAPHLRTCIEDCRYKGVCKVSDLQVKYFSRKYRQKILKYIH